MHFFPFGDSFSGSMKRTFAPFVSVFSFSSAVEEFMINQRTSSGICLTCLFDVGERYDVEIDMLDSGDSRTTIFMFYDEEIKLNDEVFEFRFANEV